MLINITMKTPDALTDALADITDDEKERVFRMASRWMTSEYVTLQLDTEENTMTVLER